MTVRIAISAGELSGDEHAAKLVGALRQLAPDAEIRGMGGRFSRAAGVETVVDAERSASAMGFQEVLTRLPKILGAMKEMKELLKTWRPDVLVLVDFPDFNLRLAKYAKSLGIRVVYFILPKLWAWRSGRVESIKKYVDHAALIFPFERAFYEKLGFSRCTYVGHPFSTDFQPEKSSRKEIFGQLGLDPKRPTVAILPGSREGEIKRHLQNVIDGFQLLKERVPNVQGIVAVAPSIDAAKIESFIGAESQLKVTTHGSLGIMSAADAGLIKSGTSNLQAAFCNLPFVMFFITTRLTEWIVRNFVSIRQYSLVNIIRPDTVLELLQDNASPERIATELQQLLTDESAQAALRAKLAEVRKLLDSHDAIEGANPYERTARLITKGIGTE